VLRDNGETWTMNVEPNKNEFKIEHDNKFFRSEPSYPNMTSWCSHDFGINFDTFTSTLLDEN
jgi:hypothetical protein